MSLLCRCQSIFCCLDILLYSRYPKSLVDCGIYNLRCLSVALCFCLTSSQRLTAPQPPVASFPPSEFAVRTHRSYIKKYPYYALLPVHYFIQSAAFIVAKLEADNAYIVKEADLDLLMSVVPDHAVEPRCNCGRNSFSSTSTQWTRNIFLNHPLSLKSTMRSCISWLRKLARSTIKRLWFCHIIVLNNFASTDTKKETASAIVEKYGDGRILAIEWIRKQGVWDGMANFGA